MTIAKTKTYQMLQRWRAGVPGRVRKSENMRTSLNLTTDDLTLENFCTQKDRLRLFAYRVQIYLHDL